MSVKVTGEKLADTRSKVSLALPDRLRLGTLVFFLAKQPPSPLPRFVSFLSLSVRDEASARLAATREPDWSDFTARGY